MSYKEVYEKLKLYPPRAFIYGQYRNRTGCCAVGALQTLVSDLDGADLDCTRHELSLLVYENDMSGPLDETNEERYLRVLAWLEEQVKKEGA